MSRHSRSLARLADDLDAELDRHEEVVRKLAEPERLCLQCLKPMAGNALYCPACESTRYSGPVR